MSLFERLVLRLLMALMIRASWGSSSGTPFPDEQKLMDEVSAEIDRR